jgi:hypothetical protein
MRNFDAAQNQFSSPAKSMHIKPVSDTEFSRHCFSPDYFFVTTIEGRALQSERNAPVPCPRYARNFKSQISDFNLPFEICNLTSRRAAFTPPGFVVSSPERLSPRSTPYPSFPLSMNNTYSRRTAPRHHHSIKEDNQQYFTFTRPTENQVSCGNLNGWRRRHA